MGQFWIVCSVADSNHEILDGLWINRLLAIRSVRWGMPRWESPAESIDIFDLCGRQQRGALRRNCLAAEYGRRFAADGLFAGWRQRRIGINGRSASWLSSANNSPRAPAPFFADAL
jgi:hypothetical protein